MDIKILIAYDSYALGLQKSVYRIGYTAHIELLILSYFGVRR